MKQSIVKSRNQWRKTGRTATLTIRDRKGMESVVTVDRDDLEALQTYCWRILKGRGCQYVATGNTGRKKDFAFLHHVLIGKPDGDQIVFYRDGDWTNCRRKNLVVGTRSQSRTKKVNK